MKIYLTILFFFFLLSAFFIFLNNAQAASFSVTPAVFDFKTKPREILKESLTLSSGASHKLNVYAFVNNISPQTGKMEFIGMDKVVLSESLANWIEISRAVIELTPGENKEIPLTIEVNLRAKPGIYHAAVVFANGATRAEAESRLRDGIFVMVNVEVADDTRERLELRKFIPNKTFFSGSPASFSYELENVGNRPATPSGEIRIYNRRGEEIATIPVDSGSKIIDPNTKLKMASLWDSSGKLGRYKAFLNLRYGKSQQGILQDTVFFWIIPLPKILIIFIISAVLVVIIAYFIHRYYANRRRHY